MCTVSSKITVLLPTVKLSAFTYYESRQFYFILPTSTPPPTHAHTHRIEVGGGKQMDRQKWIGKTLLTIKGMITNTTLFYSATQQQYGTMAVCFFFFPWPSSSVWPAAEDVGPQPPTHPGPVSGALPLSLWQDNRRSPPAEPQCQPQ